MKVKDVIISALNVLGRGGLAELLSSGATLDGEGTETVNTLLYCFNAVEDELARKYIPLSASETLRSTNCKFYFKDFAHTPVKIKRVRADGKDAEYQLLPQYIGVDAKIITVEYDYTPSKKKIDGDGEFGYEVSEQLLAYGMAAEYCLINGEIEACELWERKYRNSIDILQRILPACASIPPRRWV